MSKSLPYTFRHSNGQLYFKRRIPASCRRRDPELPEFVQISLRAATIDEALPAWKEALDAFNQLTKDDGALLDRTKASTNAVHHRLEKNQSIPTRSDVRLAVERWYVDYLSQHTFDADLKNSREYGHLGGRFVAGLPESTWEDRGHQLNEILPERSADFASTLWERNNWVVEGQDDLIEYAVDQLKRAELKAIATIFERANEGAIEFESDRRRREVQRRQRGFSIHDAIADYKRRFPSKSDMLKKIDAAGSAWSSLISIDELSRISAREAIEFIDLLRQVPARRDLRFKNMSLRAAIEANSKLDSPYPCLKAKTIKTNYIGPLATVVNEAMTKQLASSNPFYGIKVRGSTKQPAHRRSFFPGELKQIFEQPVFTGFKSVSRRNTPGDMLIKDHFYWPAIIALYTGMRAAEIGTLQPSDLKYVQPENRSKPYLEVRGTKSDSAHRWVPVHPDLKHLGLIDYVDEQQALQRDRLFPDWRAPKGKALSDARCIRNFNTKVAAVVGGYPNPSFHCLRHTLSTELINADFNSVHRRFILGHAVSKKDISDVYYTAMMDRIYDDFVASVQFDPLGLA